MYSRIRLRTTCESTARGICRSYEATPEPKLVVAIGDCGANGGIFGESYATPSAIIQGILTAVSARRSLSASR
jgi:Ni,Fe-hydrogenase III small subunit